MVRHALSSVLRISLGYPDDLSLNRPLLVTCPQHVVIRLFKLGHAPCEPYLQPFSPSGTACWPCRQRKVKCDNKQPCENCVKREHPQLCSYKPNRSSKSTGGSDVTSHVSKKRAHSPDDQDTRELSSEAKSDPAMRAFGIPFRSKRKDSQSLTPISVDPESAEVTRYLGQNSIPALLREQTSPNDRQAGVDNIRQDMRSIFGLDNSAPFPLMSSRHLEKLTADISAELPSDREVMK